MAVIRDVSSPVGEVDWNTLLEFSRQIGYRVFPCGGSGLKYCGGVLEKRATRCLPLWGKWIEMPPAPITNRSALCLPLWGKWIEIQQSERPFSAPESVFPCGGSGLKSELAVWSDRALFVSSPVGEVDWNTGIMMEFSATIPCLPLWGKWIEIS